MTIHDYKGQRSWFVDPATSALFGEANRFEVTAFNRKVVPDLKFGEKDASELSVLDHKTGKIFVLVMKVELKVP